MVCGERVPPLGPPADAEVGDGAVDLGLLPPLLELLLAPHRRKLVQLLHAVVVHHAVARRPPIQVHRYAPEILRHQKETSHFFSVMQYYRTCRKPYLQPLMSSLEEADWGMPLLPESCSGKAGLDHEE